jgi:hypothetical protein
VGINEVKSEVSTRRFVLELLDDVTQCPIDETTFEVDDLDDLCTLVSASIADIDRFWIELETEQVAQLKSRFKVALESRNLIVRLRAWRRLDDLPYKVHTNRELALMLQGSKPLAYFSGQYPPPPEVEEIPETLFDPYVAAGRFVKREYVVPMSEGKVLGTYHVLYALPNQEWRINAMILLLDTAAKAGWSEGFERMYGSLLGYEAWQNDIYIETIYKQKEWPS